MHKTSLRRGVVRFLAGAVFMVHSLAVLADPEADYKSGAASFAQGDIVTAMVPLKRAADAGHAAAQWMYGYILDGTDADEEAVAYYRKSAAQGYPEGQFSLGAALMSGEGVKTNRDEGIKWIRHSAEGGYVAGINQMALLALREPEVLKDQADALRWIREAADKEFIPAMEGLESAYRKGAFGLQQDDKQADEWMNKVLKAKGLDPKKRKRKGAAK